PDVAVPPVEAALVHAEGAVARREVDVARRVGGRPATGLPDAAPESVRAGHEHHFPLERPRIVAEEPPVPRPSIAMTAEGDVHHALAEEERRPLELSQRVEGHATPDGSLAGAIDGRVDHDRSPELLGPGGDVESMQPLDVPRVAAGDLLRLGYHVQGV